MNSFSPLEELQRATRNWWLLVVLILAGGLTGYAVHLTRPPLYEARATLSITIDYTQTGNLDLTDEDMMLDVAGKMVFIKPVRDAALAQAQAEGLPVDEPTLLADARLERRLEEWDLIFRHTNPQVAARIVNLLMLHGMDALTQAGEHARLAMGYRTVLASLEGCLSGGKTSPQASPPCTALSIEEIQTRITQVNDVLMAEVQASQGLNPAILFALKSLADVPARPTVLGRNSLILSGGLIGLLAGIWLSTSSLPDRLIRKTRRA